jgi:hypothetical protein
VTWGLESFIPEGHPTSVAAAERALGVQISDPWEGSVRQHLEAIPDPEREGSALDALARQALGIEETERITRNVQMQLTRLITGAGFITHNGQFRWQQQRRRYGGGQSRSGYRAVPVPSFQPRSDDSWGGWNGQKPWEDRDLCTLFQPFQPFRKGEEGNVDRGTHRGVYVSPCAVEGMQRKVGTVGTPHQTPSGASDLPVPIGRNGSQQGPSVGTAPKGTACPTAGDPPPPGLLTNTQMVENALAELGVPPNALGALDAVHKRLGQKVSKPRIAEILQELIAAEKEDQQDLFHLGDP